ncbi:Uncharacterised protein [uncultured archaeon]|nr:Uncharacterised protein [uncultured archaeon]
MSQQMQAQVKPTSTSTYGFTSVRTGLLQRKCAFGNHTMSGECEERRKKLILQRSSINLAEPSEVPPIVHDVLRSPGQPLDTTTRAFMEPRFGYDFSQIRIHTDAVASRSADAIGARAYTLGNEIIFGTGQYSPATYSSNTLLAHELVHVRQQHDYSGPVRHTLTPYSHPAEVEARSVSESIVAGRSMSPIRTVRTLNPQAISLQLDPRKIYCALHAAVCLGLTENPPAAALCWANFARQCAGAVASAGANPQAAKL